MEKKYALNQVDFCQIVQKILCSSLFTSSKKTKCSSNGTKWNNFVKWDQMCLNYFNFSLNGTESALG